MKLMKTNFAEDGEQRSPDDNNQFKSQDNLETNILNPNKLGLEKNKLDEMVAPANPLLPKTMCFDLR